MREYRKRRPRNKVRENLLKRTRYSKSPEKVKAQNKAYYKRNKHKFLARNSRRRKLIQSRTPVWADKRAIELFYRDCPPGYHVDHIIPLRGVKANGLHVVDNLQYLPAIENLKKSNKLQEI